MNGRPAIIEREEVFLTDTELVARLFRALGDGTRLQIVELLLEEGDLHQMELVRRIGASQTRVSEHMACLLWCGFVESRQVGRKTVYHVNRKLRSLLKQTKAFLEDNEAQIATCRRID